MDADDNAVAAATSSPEALSAARVLAYLRHAPIPLAIRELNRLVAIQTLQARWSPPDGPVLDVGCGDGFWWSQQSRRDVFGVDISDSEVARAARRITAIRCDVSKTRPFPEVAFAEVVGNCSLEHVRDVNSALANMRACLSQGGRLILFVPTVTWAYQGHLQRFLLRHAPRLAMAVAGAFNGFFQHWHLYDRLTWTELLNRHGFRVVDAQGLGSERAEFFFRLFLPLSFLSFVGKTIAGRYPSELLRFVPDRLLRPLATLVIWALERPLVPPDSEQAYELAIVAEAE